jgi:hypothetical protein
MIMMIKMIKMMGLFAAAIILIVWGGPVGYLFLALLGLVCLDDDDVKNLLSWLLMGAMMIVTTLLGIYLLLAGLATALFFLVALFIGIDHLSSWLWTLGPAMYAVCMVTLFFGVVTVVAIARWYWDH